MLCCLQGSSKRLLQVDSFAPFEPLKNTVNRYGSWGGSWVLAPAAQPAAVQPQRPRGGLTGTGRAAPGTQNGRTRRNRVPTPQQNQTSSGGSSNTAGAGGTRPNSNTEAGPRPGPAPGPVLAPGPTRLSAPGRIAGAGISNTANYRSTTASNAAMGGSRAWFNPSTGAFQSRQAPSSGTGSSRGSYIMDGSNSVTSGTSISRGAARMAAAVRSDVTPQGDRLNAGAGDGAAGNANKAPQGGNSKSSTTVLDAEPVETVNVPANAFDAGARVL